MSKRFFVDAIPIFLKDDLDDWDDVIFEFDFFRIFEAFLYKLDIDYHLWAKSFLVDFIHFVLRKPFEQSFQDDKFILTGFLNKILSYSDIGLDSFINVFVCY